MHVALLGVIFLLLNPLNRIHCRLFSPRLQRLAVTALCPYVHHLVAGGSYKLASPLKLALLTKPSVIIKSLSLSYYR
jgi:hypothetical protein